MKFFNSALLLFAGAQAVKLNANDAAQNDAALTYAEISSEANTALLPDGDQIVRNRPNGDTVVI